MVNAGIRQSVRHMHMLGVIAPFAAASSGANTFLLLTKAMAKFIKVPPQALVAKSPIRVPDNLSKTADMKQCLYVFLQPRFATPCLPYLTQGPWRCHDVGEVNTCTPGAGRHVTDATAVQIYLLLLFLRVLLSWFPAFNWERQPWLALRQVGHIYWCISTRHACHAHYQWLPAFACMQLCLFGLRTALPTPGKVDHAVLSVAALLSSPVSPQMHVACGASAYEALHNILFGCCRRR